MPDMSFVCNYCDARWKAFISSYDKKLPNCPKCNVSSDVRPLPTKDVFGYGDQE